MDDRKLQIFLAAARTGSFSQTAAETNCTQSAVTQAMNALETELGCKLFRRDHSGVRLTAEGSGLLPAIAEADAALSRIREQAAYARGKEPIRLGAFSSIANTWLPKMIRAYQENHPRTDFSIRIGTDMLAGWLQAGEIDLALGDRERCGDFQWYPLMDDPYYAVIPSNLVPVDVTFITQEQLVTYPFILAPMNAPEVHLRNLPEKSVQVNCDDDATLLAMVAQNLGVTAMPGLSLSSLPERVRAVELVPATKRVIGAAAAKSPRREVREFIAFLLQHFTG